MQNNFPKVYACFDKIKQCYVTGAKGQFTFDSTRGLKLSLNQKWKYDNVVMAYQLLKDLGVEKSLLNDYENLASMNTEVTNSLTLSMENEMIKLTTGSKSWRYSDPSAKYAKEAKKFKLKINNQSRFVVHTIESATVKEVK